MAEGIYMEIVAPCVPLRITRPSWEGAWSLVVAVGLTPCDPEAVAKRHYSETDRQVFFIEFDGTAHPSAEVQCQAFVGSEWVPA